MYGVSYTLYAPRMTDHNGLLKYMVKMNSNQKVNRKAFFWLQGSSQIVQWVYQVGADVHSISDLDFPDPSITSGLQVLCSSPHISSAQDKESPPSDAKLSVPEELNLEPREEGPRSSLTLIREPMNFVLLNMVTAR